MKQVILPWAAKIALCENDNSVGNGLLQPWLLYDNGKNMMPRFCFRVLSFIYILNKRKFQLNALRL